MSADEVERFFGSLPRVVRELESGRKINRFLAAFGLVTILVLAWRTEVQDNRIEGAAYRDRVSAFEACRVANDNARALNSFIDAALAAVKANDALTESEKDYRISVYQSIKQRLPVCERP